MVIVNKLVAGYVKNVGQNHAFVFNSHNTTWKSPYETLNKMLPQTLTTKPASRVQIDNHTIVDVIIKK